LPRDRVHGERPVGDGRRLLTAAPAGLVLGGLLLAPLAASAAWELVPTLGVTAGATDDSPYASRATPTPEALLSLTPALELFRTGEQLTLSARLDGQGNVRTASGRSLFGGGRLSVDGQPTARLGLGVSLRSSLAQEEASRLLFDPAGEPLATPATAEEAPPAAATSASWPAAPQISAGLRRGAVYWSHEVLGGARYRLGPQLDLALTGEGAWRRQRSLLPPEDTLDDLVLLSGLGLSWTASERTRLEGGVELGRYVHDGRANTVQGATVSWRRRASAVLTLAARFGLRRTPDPTRPATELEPVARLTLDATRPQGQLRLTLARDVQLDATLGGPAVASTLGLDASWQLTERLVAAGGVRGGNRTAGSGAPALPEALDHYLDATLEAGLHYRLSRIALTRLRVQHQRFHPSAGDGYQGNTLELQLAARWE